MVNIGRGRGGVNRIGRMVPGRCLGRGPPRRWKKGSRTGWERAVRLRYVSRYVSEMDRKIDALFILTERDHPPSVGLRFNYRSTPADKLRLAVWLEGGTSFGLTNCLSVSRRIEGGGASRGAGVKTAGETPRGTRCLESSSGG